MNTIANRYLDISQLHADRAKDLRLPQKGMTGTKTDGLPGTEIAEKSTAPTQRNAEIGKLSEEFESLFLGLVLKSMRDSVQKSGLIDGGNAENIYRSMLDDEYAKQMAAQHHTGLADQIADFLNGQNQVRGQKAYDAQGLPDDAKQATIGSKKVTPAPNTPTIPLLQEPPSSALK